MLKDFPIKIDSVGRLVIPKEIRDKYVIDTDSMYFVIDTDSILLKRIDSVVKIDSYGRILIPKMLRDKFNINNSSSVLLSVTDDGLVITNDYNGFKPLIDKLIYIEKKHDIKSCIYDKGKIIYSSTCLQLADMKDFNLKRIYIDSNTDTYILLIYKEASDEIISLLTALLI